MEKTIYTKQHKHIVKQLIKARKEAGLKQEDVANRLGRPQSFISRVESGQYRISVVDLTTLAKIYKKKLDFFLE
ncbi:MAG: helix-turn-helix transcriptional regulator [Candidatus Omnitrophota bacterium]|nr:MAG: helix-turn-helix transcriptional regulator [Candidatus Omnitrophota bacterium]